MLYLLDTDWVIDYIRGIPQAVSQVNVLAAYGLGLSIISLAELYEGLPGSRRPELDRELLDDFLAGIDVLPLDELICREFAGQRRRLRLSGNLISDFDLLIGSTAIHHNFTLLTNNRRHFRRMEGLRLLPEIGVEGPEG